jgi:hypothetical protein
MYLLGGVAGGAPDGIVSFIWAVLGLSSFLSRNMQLVVNDGGSPNAFVHAMQ